MEEIEKQYGLTKILLTYLLMEKKQETQLSMAFAILAQERHTQFHTVDQDKNHESNFGDCKNEKCVMAMNVIRDSRSMSVEVNELTVDIANSYKLTVSCVNRILRAWLTPKEAVQPSIIIPGEDNGNL